MVWYHLNSIVFTDAYAINDGVVNGHKSEDCRFDICTCQSGAGMMKAPKNNTGLWRKGCRQRAAKFLWIESYVQDRSVLIGRTTARGKKLEGRERERVVVEEKSKYTEKRKKKKKENLVRFRVVQYLCDVMCDDRKISSPLFHILLSRLICHSSNLDYALCSFTWHNGQHKQTWRTMNVTQNRIISKKRKTPTNQDTTKYWYLKQGQLLSHEHSLGPENWTNCAGPHDTFKHH